MRADYRGRGKMGEENKMTGSLLVILEGEEENKRRTGSS